MRRKIHVSAFAGDDVIVAILTNHEADTKPGPGPDDADHATCWKRDIRPGNVPELRFIKRRGGMIFDEPGVIGNRPRLPT